jgi:hypothetical protein
MKENFDKRSEAVRREFSKILDGLTSGKLTSKGANVAMKKPNAKLAALRKESKNPKR